MLATKSPIWNAWLLLLRVCETTTQDAPSDARSLTAAVQNINGASSIISLLPVLTGKTQNIKSIAARTFPGSLSILGVGAGRVLSKLQVGLMLLSTDLYRNVVSDLGAPHQEYVNAFSPSLIHVPTGTPERHASNVVVNHNLTEDYMLEAWFQTQGLPAKVELSQRNNQRTLCGLLAYLLMYAIDTFIGVQNAATHTAVPLIALQVASGLLWISAICLLQAVRGQGLRFIYLNRVAIDYRCFQVVVSGKHVHSVVLSTQLDNIRQYNLFDSKYENRRLKLVGAAMVSSAILDVFATFLVVGLNEWAYGWLVYQVFIISLKVVFSLEPIRRVPIVNVQALGGETPGDAFPVLASSPSDPLRKTRLPIFVQSSPEFIFKEVCIHQNVIFETRTQFYWHSRTPGLFIGQPYYMQRPKLPEKEASEPEKTTPTLPMGLPPSSYTCTTSQGSLSTSISISETRGEITEIPRIVVSTASSPADGHAPPLSFPLPSLPVAPPLARSTSSNISLASRAPTPPAKSPPTRSATLPPPSSRPASPPINPALRATPPHPPRPPRPTHPPPPVPTTVGVPIIATPKPKRASSGSASSSPELVRYLTLEDGRLTLAETQPPREAKDALPREFLACLAEIVCANKVPSADFLQAIETTREGIRGTMSDTWYMFGTADLLRYMRNAYRDLLWRKYL